MWTHNKLTASLIHKKKRLNEALLTDQLSIEPTLEGRINRQSHINRSTDRCLVRAVCVGEIQLIRRVFNIELNDRAL